MNGRVHSDASAAIGIINRTGVGRLRHVRTQYLWLQDKVRSNELVVKKVAGEENPADLMTKNVPEAIMRRHLEKIGFEALGDRAASAPELSFMEDPERDKRLDAQRGPAQEDWWYQEGKVVERIHSRPRVETFVPCLRVVGL